MPDHPAPLPLLEHQCRILPNQGKQGRLGVAPQEQLVFTDEKDVEGIEQRPPAVERVTEQLEGVQGKERSILLCPQQSRLR